MKLKFPMIAKTATYGLMHMVISFAIAWFVGWYMTGDVTGSLHIALGISLLEPSIQIFGYFLHEKAWQKWGKAPAGLDPNACDHHGHKH